MIPGHIWRPTSAWSGPAGDHLVIPRAFVAAGRSSAKRSPSNSRHGPRCKSVP